MKLVGPMLGLTFLVVLTSIACGRHAPTASREDRACENIVRRCGGDDAAQCARDFPKTREALGDETYGPLLGCVESASSCAEMSRCGGGLLTYSFADMTK